jgi:hypothetical protein
MRTRTTHDIPVRLAAIRRGFDRWRRTRQGRSRIPEELWALAVEAAGQYGLNSTAQALRLDYYSLKKHIEAARREPARGTTPSHRGPEGQAASAAVPAGGVQDHSGQLPGSWPAAVRRRGGAVPRGVPLCAGELGRGLQERRPRS